ncbi:hypothetical protein Taro_020058 [Colocasia esculenta]|uniref:non-specific serine/threonine protein kinase n=1 Tax=Colocasia esculenta TaxID=4460 RepID=A0A843UYI2_COLES|nr:hypothetical protein [Colocasia esculenta]
MWLGRKPDSDRRLANEAGISGDCATASSPEKFAVVLVGAAGAVALVGITVIVIRVFILHGRSVSRTSETNSSDPSLQVGQNVELPLRGDISYPSDFQGPRCFSLEELNQATKNFSEINLIGAGKFGEVYKGLLPDMVVAIKKRPAAPTQEFIREVQKLSSIRHRNIVSLLGYCQENDLQILVYEYLPNGSIATHLYGDFLSVYSSSSPPEHAQNYRDSSDISTLVDPRMASNFTAEGMRELLQVTVWCLNPSTGKRPPMSFVVSELDRILEKEMSLTTIMGEGTSRYSAPIGSLLRMGDIG